MSSTTQTISTETRRVRQTGALSTHRPSRKIVWPSFEDIKEGALDTINRPVPCIFPLNRAHRAFSFLAVRTSQAGESLVPRLARVHQNNPGIDDRREAPMSDASMIAIAYPAPSFRLARGKLRRAALLLV